MFGREKKEEDRITGIDFDLGKIYFVRIKTEPRGDSIVPITTNLSEDEIRALIEGYIAQTGKFDSTNDEFRSYVYENGYSCRMPNQWVELGPLVNSYEWQIYKK